MEQGFIDILQKIAKEQGRDALTDTRKCKSLLADYTRNEYKKESRLIIQAVEAGVAKAIDGADELELCKEAQIRTLEEDGLNASFAQNIVNTLALVLRGDTTVTLSPNAKNPVVEIEARIRAEVEAKVRAEVETKAQAEPKMVFVRGGTFMMGATQEQLDDCNSNEKPAHLVTLSDYYIGKYPVTQRLWKRVMSGTPIVDPSKFKGDDLPIETVSWNDIVEEFLPRLNAMTGKTYRLPTEAEWEYAARGGNKSVGYKYSGGDTLEDVAWYYDNSGGKTHEVGTRAPNELGIYDMSGNVWEWVSDWYEEYSSGAQTNPTGPSSGSYRVGRGGSWGVDEWYCRVSNRSNGGPDYGGNGIGFRLVLSPPLVYQWSYL